MRSFLRQISYIGICTVILIIASCGMFGLVVKATDIQSSKLQNMIDDMLPGEQLVLTAGTYEGPLVIDKPLTLIANNDVIVRSDDEGPILTVRANFVNVSGFHFLDQRAQPTTATIVVEGEHNHLAHLFIETSGPGVRLEGANFNKLEHLVIERLASQNASDGSAIASPGRKWNGIDLWQSSNNVIAHSKVTNMLDGIYVEQSHANVIHDNEVTQSRYGYHFMFSNDNELIDNQAMHNVSGAMIMGVKRTTVKGNVFAKQTTSVSAQGLLLFNAHDSVVEHNKVVDNRLGIFVESATNNLIAHNEVSRNFVGLQLLDAEDNTFEHNTFVSNVVQAQAYNSAINTVQANYWDDLQGIDLTGAGHSSLPYRVNPFFLTLTEVTPAFQLFFASPGLQFLEDLLYSPTEAWFQDDQPSMKPHILSTVDGQSSGLKTGMIGGLLMLCSTSILIISGVKRT